MSVSETSLRFSISCQDDDFDEVACSDVDVDGSQLGSIELNTGSGGDTEKVEVSLSWRHDPDLQPQDKGLCNHFGTDSGNRSLDAERGIETLDPSRASEQRDRASGDGFTCSPRLVSNLPPPPRRLDPRNIRQRSRAVRLPPPPPRRESSQTRHQSRMNAGRPVSAPPVNPSETELPEAAETVNTSWWTYGGVSGGVLTTGAGVCLVVVASLNVLGLALIGGGAFLGFLALGIGKWRSHEAASLRERQVQQAMQSLEKKGIRFSQDDVNRLEMLSTEDWGTLLKVPNIRVTDQAVQAKKSEIKGRIDTINKRIEKLESRASVYRQKIEDREPKTEIQPSNNEKVREDALTTTKRMLAKVNHELADLREQQQELRDAEVMSPKFNYRKLIRERAVLDVAKNAWVSDARDVVPESDRRQHAKKLVGDAARLKDGMIDEARQLTLRQDPPLPKGTYLFLQDQQEAGKPVKYDFFRHNFHPLSGFDPFAAEKDGPEKSDEGAPAEQGRQQRRQGQLGEYPEKSKDYENPLLVAIPVNDQSDYANTRNPQNSKEYRLAQALLYRLFFDANPKIKLTTRELTGVRDEADVEQINQNLTNAAIERAFVTNRENLTNEQWVKKRQSRAEVASKLAAKNPKRFAALFEIPESNPNKSEVQNRKPLYDAMHGVLFAMAEAGHKIGELEDARHRLTPRVESQYRRRKSRKLIKKFCDVLVRVSRGAPVGKAMAFELGYGYERGRRGWSDLNYIALREGKEYWNSWRSQAAAEAALEHPVHRGALVRAGLDEDTVAYVMWWVNSALENLVVQASRSSGARTDPFEVDEKMKELLELDKYASKSAQYAQPHLASASPGLLDQRKDKIRAIVYVLGTVDPEKVEDIDGNSELAALAEQLCGCSGAQIQEILDLLNLDNPPPSPSTVFNQVWDRVMKDYRNDNRILQEQLFELQNPRGVN